MTNEVLRVRGNHRDRRQSRTWGTHSGSLTVACLASLLGCQIHLDIDPEGSSTDGAPSRDPGGADTEIEPDPSTSGSSDSAMPPGDATETTAAADGDTSGEEPSGTGNGSTTGGGDDDGMIDEDGDGFPSGLDCDDSDPSVHPGAADDPTDDVDSDCDPLTDDLDGDGWSTAFGDCDDSDPNVSPSAEELLNGLDDNCNGQIDEEYGGSVSPNLQTTQVAGIDYDYATTFGHPIGDGSLMTHAQDYPVDEWYVCTGFQQASWCNGATTHLGLDWNDDFGTDQGRAVRSIGAGVVVATGWGGAGWGDYVIVRHDAGPGTVFTLPGGDQTTTVVSLYAHLQNTQVAEDDAVTLGMELAEIGPTAAGSSAPHLHHEVGADLSATFPGVGYSSDTSGRVDPSEFVLLNQTLMTVYDAVEVAAGSDATCVRRAGGQVRCWGWPYNGALGYGPPPQIIGDDEAPSMAGDMSLGGPAIDISAGASHMCAVLAGGSVRCWGGPSYGQLGYGNLEFVGNANTPSDVGDISLGGSALAVSAGYSHTCALMNGGHVRCWGQGEMLGHGSTADIGDDEAPSSVGNVPLGAGSVIKVAAGVFHTCALHLNGTVRCWGNGSAGQLGYGNTNDIGDDEPASAAGTVNVGGFVVDIDTGDHFTCALLSTGGVRCWGFSGNGQLGYGNAEWVGDNETPASVGDIQLGGLATAISAGDDHACALLDTGDVRCWGDGSSGRLGYGNENDIGDDEHPSSAGNVDIGGVAMAISAGSNRTCALLQTGAVRCWGEGSTGVLGYGNENNIGDDEAPASAGDVPFL